MCVHVRSHLRWVGSSESGGERVLRLLVVGVEDEEEGDKGEEEETEEEKKNEVVVINDSRLVHRPLSDS